MAAAGATLSAPCQQRQNIGIITEGRATGRQPPVRVSYCLCLKPTARGRNISIAQVADDNRTSVAGSRCGGGGSRQQHLSKASWCSRLKPEARSSWSMQPSIAATASCPPPAHQQVELVVVAVNQAQPRQPAQHVYQLGVHTARVAQLAHLHAQAASSMQTCWGRGGSDMRGL